MFAGKQVSVMFAMQLFRDLEATSGWRFVTLHFYDFEGTHPVHRFKEHAGVIAVADHLPSKVPNYVSYTQKALKCNICMSLVGWVLQELNIVPSANGQEVWLLCVTQQPHPITLLVTCVESDLNVAVAFNRRCGLPEE